MPRNDGSEDAVQNWREKAAKNQHEWGEQSAETLLIAMQEELGELSQALLEYRAEDGHYDQLYEEMDDLGALLIQFFWAINGHRIQGGMDDEQ